MDWIRNSLAWTSRPLTTKPHLASCVISVRSPLLCTLPCQPAPEILRPPPAMSPLSLCACWFLHQGCPSLLLYLVKQCSKIAGCIVLSGVAYSKTPVLHSAVISWLWRSLSWHPSPVLWLVLYLSVSPSRLCLQCAAWVFSLASFPIVCLHNDMNESHTCQPMWPQAHHLSLLPYPP